MEFLYEGFLLITWQQVVMYVVGFILIFLAIKKEYEPALLLPMGFGAILVNLPLTGVVNQLIPGVGETGGIIEWLFSVGIETAEVFPLLLFIGIVAFCLGVALQTILAPILNQYSLFVCSGLLLLILSIDFSRLLFIRKTDILDKK